MADPAAHPTIAPGASGATEPVLWLAQRLAGLLLAIGLAVHLANDRAAGAAALIANLAQNVGWQIFFGLLAGLALIHGGLGVRTVWRDRRRGLAAVTLQRLTGIGLVLFVLLHVGLALASAASPSVAASVLDLYTQPIHRFPEAAVVGLTVGHALNGLRVLALERWPWRQGQGLLAWLAAGLTLIATLADVLAGT